MLRNQGTVIRDKLHRMLALVPEYINVENLRHPASTIFLERDNWIVWEWIGCAYARNSVVLSGFISASTPVCRSVWGCMLNMGEAQVWMFVTATVALGADWMTVCWDHHATGSWFSGMFVWSCIYVGMSQSKINLLKLKS